MNEERITKVSGRLYLVRDGMQMWLAEKKISKGQEYMRRTSGYYTSYESLLDGYVREQGLKLGGEDVEEALKTFAGLERKVRNIAKALGKGLDEDSEKNQQV